MAPSKAVFAVSAFLILVSRSDFLLVLVSILLSRSFLDVAELVTLPSRAVFAFSEFEILPRLLETMHCRHYRVKIVQPHQTLKS